MTWLEHEDAVIVELDALVADAASDGTPTDVYRLRRRLKARIDGIDAWLREPRMREGVDR